MRHSLALIAVSWLAITVCWALFTWLNGASWVLPAIVAALLPVVVAIFAVPFLLTWIGEQLARRMRR